MSDKEFLKLVRATIAEKEVLKKDLARMCGISRPYFSEMIHADRPMTDAVKELLIDELNLRPILEKLNGQADLDANACEIIFSMKETGNKKSEGRDHASQAN